MDKEKLVQDLNKVASNLVTIINALRDEVAEKKLDEAKGISLEAVRAVLADKSRNGKTAEVRELLIKHGAEKLSAIAPSEYPALLKEAEVL